MGRLRDLIIPSAELRRVLEQLTRAAESNNESIGVLFAQVFQTECEVRRLRQRTSDLELRELARGDRGGSAN